MNYLTELLRSSHRKKDFTSGNDLLDHYLHYQAGQDVRRKLSACFVRFDPETDLIQGYYTLSSSSITSDSVPEPIRHRFPASYSSLPTILLERLAVDIRFQNKGIGKLLLMDALKRSYDISQTLGSFTVIVDPVDINAEEFYFRYGFIKLPDSGKMFLPMQTIKRLFV